MEVAGEVILNGIVDDDVLKTVEMTFRAYDPYLRMCDPLATRERATGGLHQGRVRPSVGHLLEPGGPIRGDTSWRYTM